MAEKISIKFATEGGKGKETSGQGDKETSEQGDKGTRR
jgi:hypothetical protein